MEETEDTEEMEETEETEDTEETQEADNFIHKGKGVGDRITLRWLKNDKRCEDCGIRIKFRQQFRRHMELNCLALGVREQLQNKNKIPYNCKECGIEIQHRQNVKRHKELSCPSLVKIIVRETDKKKERIPDMYNCRECGNTFKWKSSLVAHRRSMHMTEEDKSIKMFHCNLCNFRCSGGEKYLKMHVSRVHEVKTLTCDECGLKYTNHDTLRKHLKNKHW